MKTYVLVAISVIALALLLSIFTIMQQKNRETLIVTQASNQPSISPSVLSSPTPASIVPDLTFSNPKKSAHYESNTPEHGATLAGPPVNVVINFNFDLSKSSAISIIYNGNDYGIGQTTIDTNKLTLRRTMDNSAPDGLYTVDYKACWPDGSCHDGNFQFKIDRTLINEYTDLRNKTEVKIDLADLAIKPANIRISRGTKVVWTNNDSVGHYINTDSHPAHTYFTAQNSRELTKGDTYQTVFATPGVYPYHCSAHAETMKGTILVE